MSLKTLSQLPSKVPPILIDAALATLLGVVGAAQLVSRRTPFGLEDGRFRGIRIPGIGPGPDGSPITAPLPPPEGFPEVPTILIRGALPGSPPGSEIDLLTYLLVGFCAASLLLRRHYPLASLAGVTLFGALFLAHGLPPFSVQLIVLVAIYTTVADSRLTRLQAIAVSLGAGAILGAAIIYSDLPRQNANWAMDAAWILAAIFLGDSVRSRRAYELEAERTRDEEHRRRLSDERVRIARELHDVVGHNISLITVQAGAGEHVLYKDQAQAREAFANIRNASHETMQELRSMVGVLRDASPNGAPQTVPTQGLDALDSLIKAVTDAGQEVELSVRGRRHALPGVVDLSAYRILQEALTNAVRHAPHSRVQVNVNYTTDGVSLEVTNGRGDEPPTRDTGGGLGLVGMRERVQAIGGKLEAGPSTDGGFTVKAVLPAQTAG
jgi:signal transduction histidine kinase